MQKAAKRTAVFGGSGMGKSTRVRELISEPKAKRVVVFDLLDEYHADLKVSSLPDLADALREKWECIKFSVSYVPPASERAALDLHRFSLMLIETQRPYKAGRDNRELTVVVEEMAASFPVHALPVAQRGFVEVCLRGRHYGLNVIGTSQRPANVSADWRGNVDVTYWFRPQFEADLQVAVRQMKMALPTVEEELRALDRHDFLRFEGTDVFKGRNAIGK